MNQSLKIYDAKPEHCEALAEIMRSNAPLYDDIMPGAFERYAHTFVEHGLPQNYDTQMIEYSGEVVGFIGTVTLTDDTLYLVALYLKKEDQSRGIGKVALTYLWPKFRANGIKEVVLLAHQKAIWAKQFYEKMGFSHIASDESTIRDYKEGILSSRYLKNTDLYIKKI